MKVHGCADKASRVTQNPQKQAKVYKLDLSRRISAGSSYVLSQIARSGSKAARFGALLALLCLAPGAARPQQCADCHDAAQKMGGKPHSTVECSTCHSGHEEYPHPAESPKITCDICHDAVAGQFALGVHGQERAAGNEAAPECSVCHGAAHDVDYPGTTPFRRATIGTCGMCHSEEAEKFQASVHGHAIAAGNREAPTCTTCHGEHAIAHPSEPTAATNSNHVRETCAQCHGDVALMGKLGLPTDRILSFDASFHGLAMRSGSQTVANCGSCHGIHDILPSADPKSMVHDDNLPQTCGSCHPGAGARFAIGPVHVVEGAGEAPIADLIRDIYLVLIPLVLGLMALHNIGDWVRKTRLRLGAATAWVAARGELRMFPLERVQHALLAVSFILLTWTGFALKFPDGFWAYPLVMWESSWPVRGTLHRIAAGVMIGVAAMHLVTLIASPRLRAHWRELLPLRRDIREGIDRFLYNLGLRKTAPRVSPHSYVEKAEYWAVAWGTVIMTASGIILWANNFFLAWLPKAAMDIATVVHYYEAILAAAAIVVWHFYSVIFDPDVYPMNLAWLTGQAPAKPGPMPEPPPTEPDVLEIKSAGPESPAAASRAGESSDKSEEPHSA